MLFSEWNVPLLSGIFSLQCNMVGRVSEIQTENAHIVLTIMYSNNKRKLNVLLLFFVIGIIILQPCFSQSK